MSDKPKYYPSWDTVIFFLITVLGFVFSVQRLVSPQQRAVASVESGVGGPSDLSDVVDLGCVDLNDRLRPIANTSGWVRFKGRVCGDRKTSPVLEDVAVRNTSSNERATVFQSVHYTFSSDGLRLEKGRNEIEVTWRQWGHPDVQSLKLDVFRK